MTLDWNKIQEKWQKAWKKAGLGTARINKSKEKFFMIFAYPGISGFLHVGHMRGFSYTDALCRFERLKGKEVLFPVGTHATGNQALSFARKVKENDPEWVNYLLSNGCSLEKLKTLTDAQKIIKYFNEVYINDYWKKFGFLCDWERFICTTFPDYEKFIQWQFKKLMGKDLLSQKPYFATACVKCGPVAVDPSETDISVGGNAEKNEYTLLKFKLGDDYLVAATLRPETIYGQTNLWINPEGKYVRVEVEGDNWIISQEAAEKLSYQKDDVILKEDVDPLKLMGRKALAPGIEREIIILPAMFVDPKMGSGIVTSVPSDAPYDYIALRILQDNEELSKKYGLDSEEIAIIKLIPIIKTKSYGQFPAKEIVENMKIHSLDDPQLKKATAEIYKTGYHTGVMTESCGKFSGKSVEEAKEMIKAQLLEENKADIFYDLSEEVKCRCGGRVVIKRIDDQWFIRYSDSELTMMSKEHARRMNIFPQEYKDNLPTILDWFGERACTRLGNWLGSKFPFDHRWTVEPISDSTLYPAYYIVSKFVNNETLKVDDLTEEFFDYVYLGIGKGKENWKEIKEEFDYFYPLDLNLGGKEHKTVHFPVFLMNHVAILPEEKWPQGIFVNWWVTGEGGKISKSKGGAVPIPKAIEEYGVDALRLYYAHIGSPHTDVIWTEEAVLNYKNALERIYYVVSELRTSAGKTGKKKTKTGTKKFFIDQWLWSRMHTHIKNIDYSMQKYDLRELASIVYYSVYDDIKWYLRRGGNNQKVIREVLEIWTKLMNPVTPHLSEELNATDKLVSSSFWPLVDEEKINRKAETGEELIKKTIEGMRNVLKLAKMDKPSQFTLFIAESWKYELFNLLSHEIKITRNIGEIMKKVLEKEEMKGRDISKLVQSVIKDVSKLPEIVTSAEEELTVMQEACPFLEQEFNSKIKIILADDSKHEKAKSAMPGKVGILVE